MKYDSEELKNLMNEVNENSDYIQECVNEIVMKCCKELDDYMTFVKSILDDVENPITDLELDDITLKLPSLLYFINTYSETVGIKEDIAKMLETRKLNDHIVKAEGTIPVKQALAKNATQNETLVTLVYQRATKQIKARTETAYEMLQSVKKVMSRRIAELELSKSAPNKIL